jgi:hypothetical protein
LLSLYVSALPDYIGSILGPIDWVPFDLLVCVLVDLALEQAPARGTVGMFYLLNPWPAAWEVIGFAGKEVDMVSLSHWVQRVRRSVEVADRTDVLLQEVLEANPAVKLLSFFEDVVASAGGVPDNVLEIQGTARKSETLRAVGMIKDEWVQNGSNNGCMHLTCSSEI